MTRKQKKELRQRASTRQLMGIDRLTDHGVQIAAGELVIFLVNPDNLSVLSPEGVSGRVRALANLLRGMTEVVLLAQDSRESFQRNKDYYRTRSEIEELPAVRRLLQQDMNHLDEIQSTTASSREFAFVVRLDRKDAGDPAQLSRLEKRFREHGFHVRLADRQDVMRLLAVYYQQDVTTEIFEEVDGGRWLNTTMDDSVLL